MSQQVKPFQKLITLGYMVFCSEKDSYEPEDVVYFDGPPKVGDTAILSDGKLWKVTRESNEQMEIIMEIV